MAREAKRRVALVTGSTSGIGLGIAEKLAEAGYSLVIHGIEKEGKEIAASLSRRKEVATCFSDVDLRDIPKVKEMVGEVERALGPIEILVNNAGIQHVAPIDDFPDEKWNSILGINLSAPFFLSRAFWPGMKARGFGRILNIASVHGLRASEFKSAYVAAKHGLVGLTKALALEGAPYGITVNALCPGYVRTPLVEHQIKDQARAHGLSEEEVVGQVMLRKQAVKQFIPVGALAEMALFLVSEAGATVTGSALLMDGGWTAQ